MKKVLSIIMTISMILSCVMLYSCGATNEIGNKTPEIRLSPYTLYGSKTNSEGGSSGVLQTATIPDEWKISRGTYQDKSAPKSYTVEVLGKKYTHSYTESVEYSLLSRPQDDRIYHTYGDIYDAFFTIDAKNQKVVAWQKSFARGMFRSDGNANVVYDMSMAEVERIAQGYVKDLVGEARAKEYTFSIENGHFYFRRYVNGHKTDEYITMVLQSDGTLYSFHLENIGMYDNVTDFSFDETKAQSMIEQKLKEYYQEQEYKIQNIDIQVQMLPSGQMAYGYVVTTDVMNGEVKTQNGETLYAWGSDEFRFTIPAE